MTATTTTFDVERVRADFPVLGQRIHGHDLVYLDNAASTQKPEAVIRAVDTFYRRDYANVHRGVHQLSQRATVAYDAAREQVREFINAAENAEILFVRGCTEAINLVARSYGGMALGPGDEVLVSAIEHHSNIVPWQMICAEKGATLKVIPMTDDGDLVLEEYRKLLSARTRLVGVVHVSNALGTVNPVQEMIRLAHEQDIPVLVDGAQAVAHMAVDVQELDCDFYTISGHKMFAPSGIGVLYGKRRWLDAMPPYQGGGDMILSVSWDGTKYAPLPAKFEAGTPNIAGAVGLGAAVDYLRRLGMAEIAAWEHELLDYATARLDEIDGVRIVGRARQKAGVISFVIAGVHPHDIGTILDMEGIAIRAGHHCAQPTMKRLGLPATARASLAFYNTFADIDRLVAAIPRIKEIFA